MASMRSRILDSKALSTRSGLVALGLGALLATAPAHAMVTRVVAEAVAAASDVDGPAYEVTEIRPQYAFFHPDQPPLEDLLEAKLELGSARNGFVAPRVGIPSVTFSLRDLVLGKPGVYHASALAAVNRAILGAVNRTGLGGITVQTSPQDIDPVTGQDRRPPEERAVRVDILTGRIADVRVLEVATVAYGDRVPAEAAADNPAHLPVREYSPIQPAGGPPGTTDLLRTDRLSDYVARLNRHPGRSVIAEISPTRERGVAYLDYKISEDKPWAVYGQADNTGTDATSDWRRRVGFRHTQLTGNDDILQLDYMTGDLDGKVHAVYGSYETPVSRGRGAAEWLRLGFRGAYNEYDASDVGLPGQTFKGKAYNYGMELIANVFQRRELFVDAFAGVRWTSNRVKNELVDLEGHEDYFSPGVGARIERRTGASELLGEVGIEHGGDSELEKKDLTLFGRVDPDKVWTVMRYRGGFSFYLEPLIGGAPGSLFDAERRANEFYLGLKGQEGFNNRLIPIEEMVAGGFYTVRGYPQAVLAADSVTIGSLEYRLHVPRLLPLRAPVDVPGVGDFRVAPQHARGRPDWDLIVRAFADAGNVRQSHALPFEIEQGIYGAGVGIELTLRRNFAVRWDIGWALRDVFSGDIQLGDKGNHENHVSFTVLY